METYLIFFGKSQSFQFEAYDTSGHILNFSSIIPDFEDLESRTIVVDKIDNSLIFGHYKLKIGAKQYSLFKVFKCAQAFDSNRIEGSIFGIAFLSTGELVINEENIKLLQMLLKSFNDLALKENKFTTTNFKSISDNIWKAFVGQITFEKIVVSPSIRNFSQTSVAISLNYINEIFIAISGNDILNNQRVYFSQNKNLLLNSYFRWEDRLDLYLFESGELIKYSKDTFENKVSQQLGSHSENIQLKIYDLELVIKQEKKLAFTNISKLKSRNRFLLFTIAFLLIVNIGYVLSQHFLFQPIKQNENIPILSRQDKQDLFNLESTWSVNLFNDTMKLRKVNSILMNYVNLINTGDSIKFEKARKKIPLGTDNLFFIDTAKFNIIIEKYK